MNFVSPVNNGRIVVVLMILLALCSLARAEEFWWENCKAPAMTSKKFKKIVGQGKYVFLEIYTKACPYCEKLYPKINKLFDEKVIGPDSNRSDILVYKLDAEEEEALADEYGVTSYPWMLMFKPNSKEFPDSYNFEHNFKSIKEYLLTFPKYVEGGQSTAGGNGNSQQNAKQEEEIKRLSKKIKELEKILDDSIANSTTNNSTVNGSQVSLVERMIRRDYRGIQKHIKSIKTALLHHENAVYKLATTKEQSSSATIPASKEEEEVDEENGKPQQYDYTHGWIIRIIIYFLIGSVIRLVLKRLGQIEEVSKNKQM